MSHDIALYALLVLTAGLRILSGHVPLETTKRYITLKRRKWIEASISAFVYSASSFKMTGFDGTYVEIACL